MDPYNKQRDVRNQVNLSGTTSGTPGASGSGETPGSSRNPPQTGREPMDLGGVTMFPPNESRRIEMTTMAQKSEQEFQRWKEENRPSAVHETPERLGGNATLAAARERQHADSKGTKLQKKLKKEELDRMRRQEEEQKNQDMKAEQRRKAEHLEEKNRLEEQRRSEQLRQDRARFLQRVEDSASSRATHTPCMSEAEESRSVRNVQQDQRRVNSAFPDKPDGKGKEREEEGVQECPFRHLPSNPPGQDLNPDPQQSHQDWTQEAEPQYEWSLMKLMNSFPGYSRVFLEDILEQCKGDYQQAYTLLDCTLN